MSKFKLGLGALLAAVMLIGIGQIFSPAAAGTLEDVKARGKLLAGVRFDSPPYGSIDANGKNVGFDIDLAKEFAKRLGVEIEFVQVTGKTRIPMLESGKVDLLVAATTHTRKRDEVVDFSIPYLTDGQRLMVRKGSGIEGVADLAGKKVTTVQGSTNEAKIKEVAPEANLVVYQEYPQAFLAFKQGLAEVFTTTVLILDQFDEEGDDFEIVGPFLSVEPIAVGVRENDSDWLDTINAMLQDMANDSTFETIWKSHFEFAVQQVPMWP